MAGFADRPRESASLALVGVRQDGKGAGMSHRRRPRWELERVIRLTVTVLNTAASMIDALRRFR